MILFASIYATALKKNGRKGGSVSCYRFQNKYKVETALRAVELWSEIKLAITNRTPAY